MYKVAKLKEIKPELEGPPIGGGQSEIILVFRFGSFVYLLEHGFSPL